MKIVQRPLFWDFLKALFSVTLGVCAVMALFELIDKLDELMKHSPSTNDLILYTLYMTPRFFKYLLPQATLICSFIVFGQLAKANGLIALKAAGARLKLLFLPFALFSLVLAGTDFVVAEFVSAPLTRKANDMYYYIVKGHDRIQYTKGDIWFMDDNSVLVNAILYDPREKEMEGVKMFYFEGGEFSKIVNVRRCVFDGKKWALLDVKEYDLASLTVKYSKRLLLDKFKSFDIYDDNKLVTDEISFFEIYEYNKRLAKAGYENTKIEVDMYAKLAYPFTCVFTMLIGIYFSTRYKMGGNIINAAVAVVISLFYWITYTMSLSLGYSGILMPELAAFLVPASFGVVGIYLYLKIQE